MMNHAWEFNTKRSFEKWRNHALDVDTYNFDPTLDADVRTTEHNYKKAEDEYGPWDVEKTTAHMGYDYYEYQADRDRKKEEEKAAEDAEKAKAAAEEKTENEKVEEADKK
jgi:hypothetical protein